MEDRRVDGTQREDEGITYRPMRPGEETVISALVAEVFMEFVGCNYPPEGVQEFLRYAQPGSLLERSVSDRFTLVALRYEGIVGMIEMREFSHICLFFVKKELHGKGIGRELLRRSLLICLNERPQPEAVDVNSSPNAVGAYERLGFRRTGSKRTVNGITFVPMVLYLTGRGDDTNPSIGE